MAIEDRASQTSRLPGRGREPAPGAAPR
jgi:hypothetical protein